MLHYRCSNSVVLYYPTATCYTGDNCLLAEKKVVKLRGNFASLLFVENLDENCHRQFTTDFSHNISNLHDHNSWSR